MWNVVLVNEFREIDDVKATITAQGGEAITGISKNDTGLIVHFLQEVTQAAAIAVAESISYEGMVRIQEENSNEYLEINVA
jgi:hypothetical protein